MLVASSTSWAWSEEIPGTRCGPEDGPWPRPYAVLQEESIWRELRLLAKPQSTLFDAEKGWRADSINFQPSLTTRTQDRYVVKQMEINGKRWSLTGIFDGHLGHVTVDHVSKHLPIIINEFLQSASDSGSSLDDPAFISDSLSQSIKSFDEAIAKDVLDLFGGIKGLANYSDAQIRQILNDQHEGGSNYQKARLNMYGTTALVALVDPDHQNLWIANLGDCQAILVSQKGSDWDVQALTKAHNGDNPSEVERVRSEHANEPEAMVNRRILGALHPTRALGDTPFKQPPEFTRRILYNLLPGFHDTSPWEDFLVRNRTPPYITAQPEVSHISLDDIVDSTGSASSSPSLPRFLILSSDGFTDLCGTEDQHRIISDWVRDMVDMPTNISPKIVSSYPHPPFAFGSPPTSPTSGPSIPGYESRNMALRLLHRALGGDDRESVSRVLTLDMDISWIDDTSIIVQTL